MLSRFFVFVAAAAVVVAVAAAAIAAAADAAIVIVAVVAAAAATVPFSMIYPSSISHHRSVVIVAIARIPHQLHLKFVQEDLAMRGYFLRTSSCACRPGLPKTTGLWFIKLGATKYL